MGYCDIFLPGIYQVYMDAVFFPRAVNDPLVLAQEGWHYEIEKKDDPLTFTGGDLGGNITVSLKRRLRNNHQESRYVRGQSVPCA